MNNVTELEIVKMDDSKKIEFSNPIFDIAVKEIENIIPPLRAEKDGKSEDHWDQIDSWHDAIMASEPKKLRESYIQLVIASSVLEQMESDVEHYAQEVDGILKKNIMGKDVRQIQRALVCAIELLERMGETPDADLFKEWHLRKVGKEKSSSPESMNELKERALLSDNVNQQFSSKEDESQKVDDDKLKQQARRYDDIEPMISELRILGELLVDVWLQIDPELVKSDKVCVLMDTMEKKTQELYDFYHK